jgi:hypothetical protein
MANLSNRLLIPVWLIGVFSILTLAGTALYPFGRPVLAQRVSPDVLVDLALGAALGAALGTFQSSLLRLRRPLSARFILYTSFGMGLAWLLCSITSIALAPILRHYFDVLAPPVTYVSGAFMGGALGISQGLAVRHDSLHPWRWAGLTALGWFLGWIVCTQLAGAILRDPSSPLWSPLVAVSFALVFSSITAVALFDGIRHEHHLAA